MHFAGKSRGSSCFVQNWLAKENCDSANLNGNGAAVVLALRKDGNTVAKPAAARLMEDVLIKSLLFDFICKIFVLIANLMQFTE